MFKFVIAGRRRAGYSRRDYSRHYQNNHGTLVLAGPGEMVSYMQNHVVDGAYGDGEAGWAPRPDFDSVSEITYPDAAAMQRSLADPHYVGQVKPDEGRFVDPGLPVLLATDEEDEPVAHRRNGAVKAMRILKAAEGTDREAFLAAWREEGRRLATHPALADRICRMVRSVSLPVPAGEVRADFAFGALLNVYAGIESVWFDRWDDLAGFDLYRSALLEPASLLLPHLSRREAVTLLVEEHPVVPATPTSAAPRL